MQRFSGIKALIGCAGRTSPSGARQRAGLFKYKVMCNSHSSQKVKKVNNPDGIDKMGPI